jgi:transposase
VVAAAKAQRHELPAAETKTTLVSEIASEVLRTKERIDALEARLAELVEAHPEGKLIMSLPGMGTIMTAEFLAEADDLSRFGSPDRFAAAAGMAPVLRASGSVSYRRRAKRGKAGSSRGSSTNRRIARCCTTSGAGSSTGANEPRGRGTPRW